MGPYETLTIAELRPVDEKLPLALTWEHCGVGAQVDR